MTKKQSFTFNLKPEYLYKVRHIANRETRSVSNLLEHLCKIKIEEYEKTYGEIPVPPEVPFE